MVLYDLTSDLSVSDHFLISKDIIETPTDIELNNIM